MEEKLELQFFTTLTNNNLYIYMSQDIKTIKF